MPTENPYSPANTFDNANEMPELHMEIAENLNLTAKVVKATTICCLVATIIQLYAWIRGFSYLAPFVGNRGE
jgi:hypothetical protein